MLFHTWPFALFIAVVLPGYLLLRRTGGWRHWLLLASCVFYGWWNPYYLVLIFYTMAMDFTLVKLMDRCPNRSAPDDTPQATQLHRDPVLRRASVIVGTGCAAGLIAAWFNPDNLRPFLLGLSCVLLLLTLATGLASRRLLLATSLVNGLGVLAFFKYADFLAQSLNTLLAQAGLTWSLPGAASLMLFICASPIGIVAEHQPHIGMVGAGQPIIGIPHGALILVART